MLPDPALRHFVAGLSGRHHRLRPRIVLQAGIEQMILPSTVNAQVFAGITFTCKTRLLQQADRNDIGGNAGCFEAMQSERAEGEGNERTYRRRHIALPGVRLAYPVTEAA